MSKPSAGWTVATLGQVAKWGSGGTPQAGNAAFYGGAIPWAVIGDLDDGLVTETASSINELGLSSSSAKIVPAGAVLVAMYGSIGKLGIAGRAMATNQAIAFAVPHVGLDPQYLFLYLLSQRRRLEAAGKGATQRNISQTTLKAWPITYPGLPEQRRIVSTLDEHLASLDVAKAGVERAQRRVAALRRSSLEATFGLGGQLGVPLRNLLVGVTAGKSFGSDGGPAAVGQWGIVRVSAMTKGVFLESENKAVPPERVDPRNEIRPGDLLVSRANTSEYVGASVLVPGTVRKRLLLSDKSMRLTPKEDVDPEWLWRALQAPSARRQISALATGTKDSMRNISQASLLSVSLPEKSRHEQERDARVYRDLDEQMSRQEAHIAALLRRSEALRRALLAAAFSGRLTGRSSDRELMEELADQEAS